MGLGEIPKRGDLILRVGSLNLVRVSLALVNENHHHELGAACWA
jgi:hypothetical protein